MSIARVIPLALAGSTLAACASIPDATIGYAATTTDVEFVVTRTVACSLSEDGESTAAWGLVTKVEPTVSYRADPELGGTFRMADLRRPMTDSDLTIEFYDDGRLKSVNSVSDGKSGEVLKSVLSVATRLGGAGMAINPDPDKVQLDLLKPTKEECEFIIKAAGEKKALTLNYAGQLALAGPAEIRPDEASLYPHSQLAELLGDLSVAALTDEANPAGGYILGTPVVPGNPQRPDRTFDAWRPAYVPVQVTAAHRNQTDYPVPLWKQPVLLAGMGGPFTIPIPDPATFGQTSVVAEFAESGALKKLKFTSKGEAEGIAGSADSVVETAQGPTTAETVAELQARINEIKLREQLAACLADPEDCE